MASIEEDTHSEAKDVLGHLFQGGISYGENGPFLTDMPVSIHPTCEDQLDKLSHSWCEGLSICNFCFREKLAQRVKF